MKKPRMQQGGERRISSALRLLMVALLLAVQVAFVVLLAHYLEQNAAAVYMLLQVAALFTALHIYRKPGDVSYKGAWIITVLFVPVVGFILYGLWSGDAARKREKGLEYKRYEEPESVHLRTELNLEKLQKAYPAWGRLATYFHKRGFGVYGATKSTYLAEGRIFLEDMLQSIEKAERFVFVEFFILAEGELYDRLFDALRRKAAEGVEVKIIFDDFGNIKRFSAESLEALRTAGIAVHIFNPVHEYVNRLYFNYRDHRKIVAVDGDTVYTGGVNIADEYAGIIERFGHWKDGGVRLTGEGAWELTKGFMQMWQRCGETLENEYDYYRPLHSVQGSGFVQSFVDGPENNPDNPAEDVYIQLIDSAKRFLYITTPYFVPTAETLRALCIAGDGGVDVRLILPGIPDHKYTDIVAESYFGELIAHGVKVYRYTPGFLHLKSVMADREAAFIGTVNMDYRSFQLHYECGTLLYGAPAIEDLLEDMDSIVADSRLVTMEEWEKRSVFKRMIEPVMRLFAIWM